MCLIRKRILAQIKTQDKLMCRNALEINQVLILDYRLNIFQAYRCYCKISLLKR